MSEPSPVSPRRRMSKQQRHTQLLQVARELIRDAGTGEFTLARLADRAGVTKPLVYDHFGDRDGVLAELYREFEARQRETLRAALGETEPDLPPVADLVAGAYIDCCLAEGRELADVVAALTGSATLNRLRQEAEAAYLDMCREALTPLAGPIDTAGLQAIVGAGDALARSALDGRISPERARDALARVVTAVATENRHPTSEETS
ncbi:TetR/AcrR family transcriptional regulator [Actinoplanes utahensis]|nr:TetR/AcrR family transcriptional regulator [Actinoplanes utahensis]GIF32482.1 TetR family transcriptional regulator [Actinoplanes utahensis]